MDIKKEGGVGGDETKNTPFLEVPDCLPIKWKEWTLHLEKMKGIFEQSHKKAKINE